MEPCCCTPDLKAPGSQGSLSGRFRSVRHSRGTSFFRTSRDAWTTQAWEDLQSCHRLGRMIARGPTLIDYLVGITINSIAAGGDLVFLDHLDMASADRLASNMCGPGTTDFSSTALGRMEKMKVAAGTRMILPATTRVSDFRSLCLLHRDRYQPAVKQ